MKDARKGEKCDMGYILDILSSGFIDAHYNKVARDICRRNGWPMPDATFPDIDDKSEKKEENNMSDNAKIAKFELFLEEILEHLRIYNDGGNGIRVYEFGPLTWTGLLLIFDYNKLNDYGKKIINIASADGVYGGDDKEQEEFLERYEDETYKVKKAKEFADLFGMEDYYGFKMSTNRKEEMFTFMFWAMMILAVDDTDREEYLSSICDLSKIWKINDEEMLDIAQIIRIVYYREEEGVDKLQSPLVKKRFEALLNHCGYSDIMTLDDALTNLLGRLL